MQLRKTCSCTCLVLPHAVVTLLEAQQVGRVTVKESPTRGSTEHTTVLVHIASSCDLVFTAIRMSVAKHETARVCVIVH